jgi:hypothetical protein
MEAVQQDFQRPCGRAVTTRGSRDPAQCDIMSKHAGLGIEQNAAQEGLRRVHAKGQCNAQCVGLLLLNSAEAIVGAPRLTRQASAQHLHGSLMLRHESRDPRNSERDD